MSRARGDHRTLEVRCEPPERTREEFRRKLGDLDSEDAEEMHVLNVSEDALQRLTSPKNVELLRAIRRQEPDSINELSGIVDRGYKEVHGNVEELADIGVIEVEESGGAKEPVFEYDDLELTIQV